MEQELQARDLSEQEKLEMTIREQSIQEKETERLRVEEERKRITEDYGKRLQNVREQKRHSQVVVSCQCLFFLAIVYMSLLYF